MSRSAALDFDPIITCPQKPVVMRLRRYRKQEGPVAIVRAYSLQHARALVVKVTGDKGWMSAVFDIRNMPTVGLLGLEVPERWWKAYEGEL